MPRLKKDIHYNVDEKSHSATMTEEGVEEAQRLLKVDNLYDPSNIVILHHVNNALKAHTLYRRDRNYLVYNDEVQIIDEHTGRLMPGRRWSDGLHQAVEAKEGVDIKSENQTLATISFQNYFRLYNKLSGMTGTAKMRKRNFRRSTASIALSFQPTNQFRGLTSKTWYTKPSEASSNHVLLRSRNDTPKVSPFSLEQRV